MVKEIEVEKGTFSKKLNVGTPENPQGITIYDKVTGEPLCVASENKVLILKEGECDSE